MVVHFTLGQLWPSGTFVAGDCLSVCLSVRSSVHIPRVCPSDKLSPVQARIIKEPEVQNNFVKISLVLGFIDLELKGQILLKSKKTSPFCACPCDKSPLYRREIYDKLSCGRFSIQDR